MRTPTSPDTTEDGKLTHTGVDDIRVSGDMSANASN
jgi:hypothetical protein